MTKKFFGNLLFTLLILAIAVLSYVELNKKDDFTVYLPTRPHIESREADGRRVTIYQSSSGPKFYTVFKIEYERNFVEGETEEMINRDDRADLYSFANAGAQQGSQMFPVESKRIYFKGYPAKIEVGQSEHRTMKTLIFYNNTNKAYMLNYIDEKEVFDEVAWQAFIESFKEN